MKHQMEVEVRGKIGNFEKTLEKFRKTAKFIEEKDRFSLIYFRGDSPINREAVKKEMVDFKLRVTNKKAEIVMKYGLVKGSESRKEILIPITLDKFGEAVELFKLLDWHKGVIMATKTFVFNYKEIEFALVKAYSHSYFEAEIIAGENDNHVEKLEYITKICKELGLAIFSEDEFYNFMDTLNNIKEIQFDFNIQKFEDIKKKFKEFF